MPELNATSTTTFTYMVGVQYTFSADPNDTEATFLEEYMSTWLLITFGCSLFLMICIFGLVGNGIVIFFLSFIIQRNPITTYVLNLAAADSGVLICFGLTLLFAILEEVNTHKISHFAIEDNPRIKSSLFFLLFLLSHYTNLHLLTAISMERCASTLFPIWYRCHRPKHQSAIVCTLIWAVSFVLIIIQIFVLSPGNQNFLDDGTLLVIVCAISLLLCTPLMVICTLTLFIRVCCSLHRCQHRRLSVILLFALFFFIILDIPLSVVIASFIFHDSELSDLLLLGSAFATINSSVNPLVYYVIGRRKSRQSRENVKVVLQRVFSDQDLSIEDQNPVEFQMG